MATLSAFDSRYAPPCCTKWRTILASIMTKCRSGSSRIARSGQPGFASNRQFAPLDTQDCGIDHLVVDDDGAEATLDVGIFIGIDNVSGPGNLLRRRRVGFVDNIDLRRMDGPFAVEAHARPHLRVAAAVFVVANGQRHAIDNGDTGGASGG